MLITLLSFKVADNRSIYNVPLKASAVCAADYDLDGDNDIIIENGIASGTNWGGIYMMENDGYGHFSYMDSIFDSFTYCVPLHQGKSLSSSVPYFRLAIALIKRSLQVHNYKNTI